MSFGREEILAEFEEASTRGAGERALMSAEYFREAAARWRKSRARGRAMAEGLRPRRAGARRK